jgi:hypothetical protein
VHHRASRDRCLTTAAEAFVGVRPALQRCRASVATGGANKTLWSGRSNRNAAQLVSSGKLAWNSLRDRALATGRPLAPAACGRTRGYYTSYGAPWDRSNHVGPSAFFRRKWSMIRLMRRAPNTRNITKGSRTMVTVMDIAHSGQAPVFLSTTMTCLI